MSTAPLVPLILSDPDSAAREAAAGALRDGGWEVLEITDAEGILEAVTARPAVVLVALASIGDDPTAFVRELRARGGGDLRVVLAFDRHDELDWDACVQAGVDDFIERPLHPELLRHRLCRLAPLRTTGEQPPGSWLAPSEFSLCLADRLATATREETKVAVLSIVLESPGRDLVVFSAEADRALTDHLGQQAMAAFEVGEGEGLVSLRAGMRLSRVQPGVILMMVPGVTRLQDTAKIGARLQEQLACPLEVDGVRLDLRVGLGVAAFPEDGCEPGVLMDNAIEAARRARREGSSLMVFHTDAMGRWAFERLTLERSLREAISRDELRVYYQPRIDAQTRRIKGMECLVRWQHPELGLVPPVQFIPLAEETGLIVPIGEWVLREACRQNQAWREMGLPEIAVSVNLSPVQFRSEELHGVVMDALTEAGLATSGLELEVTESMLMNDPRRTIKTLERLKGEGIHISIDDFGTGYSSLSYLKRFPIDALKIDRSFVMNVTTDPDDAAIATAIILMGHSLKLSVVAEGVETESQLEFLRVLQCNEIQGYLFSPPVPADRAELLLRDQAARSAAA